MARNRHAKVIEVRTRSGPGIRNVVVPQLPDLRPDRAAPVALTFPDGGNQPILKVPPHGWKVGLEDLIVRGKCPYCRNRILNIDVGRWGVAWACIDGCNP